MVLPLTEQGDNAEVFPAVNATAVEFDIYLEAKSYVDGVLGVNHIDKEEWSVV